MKSAKRRASVPTSIVRGFAALGKKHIFVPFIGFFAMYLSYGLFLAGTIIPPITGLVSLPITSFVLDALLAIAGFLLITLISTFFGGLIIDFYARKHDSLWSGVSHTTERFQSLFLVVLSTGLATLAGFALFVIPGAFLGVKFMFAQQEVMVHDKGAINAIKSSWRASRGMFWPQFSLFFAVSLISIAAYVFSALSSSTGVLLVYLGTKLFLPLDILVSFVLAYAAVFGSVAVTDYFLQRKV